MQGEALSSLQTEAAVLEELLADARRSKKRKQQQQLLPPPARAAADSPSMYIPRSPEPMRAPELQQQQQRPKQDSPPHSKRPRLSHISQQLSENLRVIETADTAQSLREGSSFRVASVSVSNEGQGLPQQQQAQQKQQQQKPKKRKENTSEEQVTTKVRTVVDK